VTCIHHLLGLASVTLLALSGAAGQEAPSLGMERIQLREAWRITEPDVEESGDLIGLIGHVSEDAEGHILLLDVQLNSVWVYDVQGNPVRSFGRPGEGPGELTRPCQIEQLPDGRYAVLESFPGRLVLYEPDGAPAGAITPRLPDAVEATNTSCARFQVAGDKLAIATLTRSFREGKMVSVHRLGLHGMSGDLESVLATHQQEMDPSQKTEMLEEDMTWLGDRWAADSSGTVFAAMGYRGYEVTAFAGAPAMARTIARPYASLKRDPGAARVAELRYSRFSRSAPDITFRISDAHKDIVSLAVRRNGELWIQPSDGKWDLDAGVLAEYDAFDTAGTYVRRVQLLGDADPDADAVFLLSKHVVVVHDFEGRARAMVGTVDSTASADQSEEDAVLVTCYGL